MQPVVVQFISPAPPNIVAGFAVPAVGVMMADRGALVLFERWMSLDRRDWLDEWLSGLDPLSLDTKEPRKRMLVRVT